jgi:hypothetical protein
MIANVRRRAASVETSDMAIGAVGAQVFEKGSPQL